MSFDIDRTAQERLAADEAITGSRKIKVTLRQTAVEFWKHPSPWMIVTVLVAAVAWRVIEGDWRWSDLIGPAVLVALFPFTLTHLTKPESELLSTFAGGAVYGWVAWRTQSIVWGALAHIWIVTLIITASGGVPIR